MTTIMQAEMDGTVAGMSSNINREDIPEEFAQRPALSEAWGEAFDKMRQSLRGTPVEAPKGMKVKAEPAEAKKSCKKQELDRKQPKVVEPEKPKMMIDILAERHPEYA